MSTAANSARLRCFDGALSAALLVLLSPLLAARALWARASAGAVFDAERRIGRHGLPFRRLRFAGPAAGAELAVLFNIFKGEMAFVGPDPLAEPADGGPASPHFALRPGLCSPQGLRRKLGLAYEADDDLDFYQRQTLRGNLGLVLRSLVAVALAGRQALPAPAVLRLLGVDIDNIRMDEALDWIAAQAKAKTRATVAFVNPDCLNIAYRDRRYREVLARADRVLPDGIGIKLAGRLLGAALLENVNGTDMFPRLCERAVRDGLALFLLGARPGVAEAAAATMRERYPGLQITGCRDGYFKPAETDAVLAAINASGADILLVALGAPRQEIWLAEHRDRLAAGVGLGVGGLFDFYSGRMRRAPPWVRELGMEWAFRLLQEPGRLWRRYLVGNPLFLYRVLRQKKSMP